MRFQRSMLFAALALMAAPAVGATIPTEKERIRAQAEHDCYDDAQKLCPDAVPDEDKITACFKVERARLSPSCRKLYDAGMKLE